MKPVLQAALLILLLVACSGMGDTDDEILVSAAASLGDAFSSIEREFEAATPGFEVALNLAGSSTLRQQILEGAPVDVFASADLSNMTQVVEGGRADGEPRVFATNRLQIAVPLGNPGGIQGLEDFAAESLFLGLCAEVVPCGGYGRQALSLAGVTPAIDTTEPDVRSLLIKIAAGELDAGITYVTDVASREGVEGVDIPDEFNVVAQYPIVALADTGDSEAARAFIAFVLSEEGQAILNDFGFRSP